MSHLGDAPLHVSGERRPPSAPEGCPTASTWGDMGPKLEQEVRVGLVGCEAADI